MLYLRNNVTSDEVRRARSGVTMPEREQRRQFAGQMRHIDNLEGGNGPDSTPGIISQPR